MIALLGALLGFFSSTVPHLLELFKDKSDKKHEITMVAMQMENQRLTAQTIGAQKLEEIGITADMSETLAIHTPQVITGIWIIDFLNGSVRPVVTYMFLSGYFTVKYAQWQILKSINFSDGWATVIQLWNGEDMAIFSTVLGYWFGQRALAQMRGK